MADPDESWTTWLRGGEPFGAEDAVAYAIEEQETNERRLRVILPLMIGVQALSVLGSRLSPSHRLDASAAQIAYVDQAWWVHALTLVVYAGLTAVLYLRAGHGPTTTRVTTGAGVAFLLHAAGLMGAAQALGGGAGPFLRAVLMVVVLFAVSPRVLGGLLGAGLAFVAVVVLAQHTEASHTRAVLVQSGVLAAVGMAFGGFLEGARRRDFRLRLTVDRQRRDLAELNEHLEERVAEQVAALTQRNAEVERLNAQLQEQVRDRSLALAQALRRLGEQTPENEADLTGLVLGGRFEVLRRVAAGGMGAVYEGTDRSTGEVVAIKVIRASSSTPLALLERFLREARSAASIAHPAVVRMLHVDIHDDGLLFQVQEFVSGETLQGCLTRNGRLAPGVAARVLAVLADALAAAHEHGIVHRDVKPANVILTPDAPGLRLVDFGISKLAVDLDDPSEATLLGPDDPAGPHTRTGVVVGTPRFMSPEQREGGGVGPPTDVYALGIVAHLMFTGAHPDRAGEAAVPPACAGLIAACLSEEPDARPASAQVAAEMQAFADGLEVGPLEQIIASDTLRRVTSTDNAPTQFREESQVSGEPRSGDVS
ncbi:MAG: protein kinase [Myxococcota bacterium]